MNKKIMTRVVDIANHIIYTNDTIRKTANIFNVSKSTVHKDLQERLALINIDKYRQIKKIMNYHLQIRHILGGESTRQLFLKKKDIAL